MKKLLILTFVAVSLVFAEPSAQAKTTNFSESVNNSTVAVSNAVQIYRQNRRNNRYQRARTFNQTRYVRYGRRTYREVYRVRYLPNGRVTTRLVSRTRVR
jgi:hypothetical protein